MSEPIPTIPPTPRTRFAPSVTGHLHLGHIVNAVYVWGIGHGRGGTVVLRLEDHDRTRFKPEFETSILDDLDWLGLVSDGGTTAEFRSGGSEFRQSDNADRYQRALDALSHRGLVYVCDCRRADREPPDADGANEPCYPGICRDRALDDGPGRRLRIRMDPGREGFRDLALGPQHQDPASQCGDLVARDAAGNWSYQFAVTVDDAVHRIDLVIRGRDLLGSTGRQIRLARLLGRDTPPAYYHHPLVIGADGRKLSKREFAKGIRDLRAEGRSPESVLGEAAYLGGLLPAPRDLPASELPDLFAKIESISAMGH
ncbi:MAG: glutamate--tRNA ligase family protein [Gemmatimonadales bacterium]